MNESNRLVSISLNFIIRALPIDTIKTVIESGRYRKNNEVNLEMKKLNFLSLQIEHYSVVRRMIAEEGLGQLFRAWPVALGRGIPSAAVTLVVYDYLLDYLVDMRTTGK